MKIAFYPNSSAKNIPRETEEIRLSRPVKHKALLELLEKIPSIKKISMNKSCFQRMPAKTKEMLEQKNIEVKIETGRGRPIGISLEKMLHIIEMRKDFQPLREIQGVTGIPKSTVHYLVKYAQRQKIRKGKEIVYLK